MTSKEDLNEAVRRAEEAWRKSRDRTLNKHLQAELDKLKDKKK